MRDSAIAGTLWPCQNVTPPSLMELHDAIRIVIDYRDYQLKCLNGGHSQEAWAVQILGPRLKWGAVYQP